VAGAKGGGSWKVAYADFVTAMMAFFLVMWIGAQDQKVRQSVANYFVDPSGVSKKPVQTGAVMDTASYGSLPKNESVSMGRGRQSYDSPREPSPATKAVGDWIRNDKERFKYWREQAQRCRVAAGLPGPENRGGTPTEVAVRELANQLRAEITGAIPADVKGVHQDLLINSINDVNWAQLAEDLLLA
jgi:flagellar motor protein MotB